MKSMFDPIRPAVFKAQSFRSVTRKLPLSLMTLAAPILLSSACQSKVKSQGKSAQNRPERAQFASGDGGQPLLESPLGFTNPLSEKLPRKITIASYNVENLFDQYDDERNQNYGDYRINPNPSGQASNYGESIDFQKKELSFTEIKIRGIRKTLIGITPQGPDIVGLVEVESSYALSQLLDSVRDLGYVSAQFSDWKPGMHPSAIGMGLISKFPIKSWDLLLPLTDANTLKLKAEQGVRPILKAEVLISGQEEPLVVYVNHWKSKASPESARIAYAEALEQDIRSLLRSNPKLQYIILGDLNSAYNENEILENSHNDTEGKTGINDVLLASGDKSVLTSAQDPGAKYNLVFEIPENVRGSAWYPAFGWSSLDHMIIGTALYDGEGLDYVDGTFQIADTHHNDLEHLFTEDGVPNRWHSKQKRRKYTTHEPGGYSDHLPLWATFSVLP